MIQASIFHYARWTCCTKHSWYGDSPRPSMERMNTRNERTTFDLKGTIDGSSMVWKPSGTIAEKRMTYSYVNIIYIYTTVIFHPGSPVQLLPSLFEGSLGSRWPKRRSRSPKRCCWMKDGFNHWNRRLIRFDPNYFQENQVNQHDANEGSCEITIAWPVRIGSWFQHVSGRSWVSQPHPQRTSVVSCLSFGQSKISIKWP